MNDIFRIVSAQTPPQIFVLITEQDFAAEFIKQWTKSEKQMSKGDYFRIDF